MIKTLQYINTPWGYIEFASYSIIETQIMADPAWQEGVFFGTPRYGHPEGKVLLHIQEIMGNLSHAKGFLEESTYRKLRLINLIHDTFKYKVNTSLPARGKNHHGYIARTFAEKYIYEQDILEIIELHDHAYHAWCLGKWQNRWDKALLDLNILQERLGPNLQLFYQFFCLDTCTGDKDPSPLYWFENHLQENIHKIEWLHRRVS